MSTSAASELLSPETIAVWFEPRVAPMRRAMMDPAKFAELKEMRLQRARGEL